jgi:hypothetical protein
MANFIYVVKIGTLSEATNMFNLSPYYVSSLKKAIAMKQRVLKDNLAENVIPSFGEFQPYDAMVQSVDYDGENGKYKGRIMIDKERVW